MDKYIGCFYIAKVNISYNNHINSSMYKYRPVLIIEKMGNNFYKAIPLTSQVSDYKYDRLDVYTDYNLDKHSQILCGEEVLVNIKYIRNLIAECKNDDFEYILKKHKKVKEAKNG